MLTILPSRRGVSTPAFTCHFRLDVLVGPPAQRLPGFALFGEAGSPDPADRRWPSGRDTAVPADLLRDAARALGTGALPVP